MFRCITTVASLLPMLLLAIHRITADVYIGDYYPTSDSSVCIHSSGTTSLGSGDCSDGEAMLVGRYVNLGIHNVGSFGTATRMQSAYYNNRLGFLADYDRNGMTSSNPGFSGDFCMPGAPLEGK